MRIKAGKGGVMAGPERIEWRRAFPSRAVVVLVWYVGLAGAVLGLTLLLFGDEPARLDSGAANPLAAIPPVAVVVAAVGAVPFVVALVRRPVVAANHYALTVRPGVVRTLVLPWSHITGVAVRRVGRETYLLVGCRRALDVLGDHPGWFDQGVLRSLRRGSRAGRALAADYDLAVRTRDFAGEPNAQLATLAAFAPDHVLIASDVEV
jgi:hypothetical protein